MKVPCFWPRLSISINYYWQSRERKFVYLQLLYKKKQLLRIPNRYVFAVCLCESICSHFRRICNVVYRQIFLFWFVIPKHPVRPVKYDHKTRLRFTVGVLRPVGKIDLEVACLLTAWLIVVTRNSRKRWGNGFSNIFLNTRDLRIPHTTFFDDSVPNLDKNMILDA